MLRLNPNKMFIVPQIILELKTGKRQACKHQLRILLWNTQICFNGILIRVSKELGGVIALQITPIVNLKKIHHTAKPGKILQGLSYV